MRDCNRALNSQSTGWHARALVILVSAALFVCPGCQTIPPLARVNTAEPGWSMRQGQGVWRVNTEAPEIAGEVFLASNSDGRALLQFTKNPLPFVTVQTSNDLWQIEFVPQKRRFSGKSTPTPRLIWVHLARALTGTKPHEPLTFSSSGQDWRMENLQSGETISGFLNP